MIFPKFKTGDKRSCKIDNFAFAKNTVYEKGVLKTRNAIKPTGEVVYEKNADNTENFTLTNAVYFKNNRYNRLCVHYEMLGSFNYRYDFKLISLTGVVTGAGAIEIFYKTENAAKKPIEIVCFSAAATKGTGIYAFISFEHSEKGFIYEIYELGEDLQEWIKLNENDMYIPLYMKNGRGTRFLTAAEELPEPEYPEELNMLSGICCCSYTTDGVSENFELPIQSEVSHNEHIKVHYFVGGNTEFDFVFDKNLYVSSSVNYLGYEISLAYNNGLLQFISTPSGFIPEKSPGIYNNLTVYIKHETKTDYEKKAYMSKASVVSLEGEGEQVVLTGNQKHPSLIFVSRASNPLYFPRSLCISVGSNSEEVVGVSAVKNKLVLFKAGSVYFGKINANKISAQLLSHNFGCVARESIQAVDNAVIFAGSDNKIYAVSALGAIKEISKDINENIEDFKFVYQVNSLVSSERYILFVDRIAYCLDLKESDFGKGNFKWHFWATPSQMRLCDVFEFAGKTVFICSTQSDTTKKYYVASFTEASEDEFYAEYEYFGEIQRAPIITAVKTGLINPDGSFAHKMFERALFYVNNSGFIKTKFLDDKGDIIKSCGINISYSKRGRKPVRLYPLFPAVQFSVTLESEAPIELEGIEFKYYTLD